MFHDASKIRRPRTSSPAAAVDGPASSIEVEEAVCVVSGPVVPEGVGRGLGALEERADPIELGPASEGTEEKVVKFLPDVLDTP